MIKHSFNVRIANSYDVHAIMQITKQAFKQYIKLAGLEDIEALNETEEQVLDDINNKIVLIATINDIPVGSVRLAINETEKTAYLSRFGVSMDYQNNGIGKVLMNVTDQIMKEHGVKHLYLHTSARIPDENWG